MSPAAAPLRIPTSHAGGFRVSSFSPTLAISHFKKESRPRGCDVASRCGFDLRVPGGIFFCACWPWVYLLWENVCPRPLPISESCLSFLLLSCQRSLYTSPYLQGTCPKTPRGGRKLRPPDSMFFSCAYRPGIEVSVSIRHSRG